MSINRLKANDDKTHVMVIHKSQTEEKLTFTIGKETITETCGPPALAMVSGETNVASI